jgi:hypothetical protein
MKPLDAVGIKTIGIHSELNTLKIAKELIHALRSCHKNVAGDTKQLI